MYWGSVRFFKHLILSTVALMIIVPTCLAVYFGIQNHNNKELAQQYKSRISSTQLPQMEYLTGVDYGEVITVPTYEYQTLYPDLYADFAGFDDEQNERPVIYLTFDDGPSLNTERVLDILKENDIKATFFVVNNNIAAQQHIYKRIAEEGHTLGIHTYTHVYRDIYSSVENYLEDINNIYTKVYETTGVKPTVFRFAGGSINVYNQHIYEELIAEMLRRGFVYYDWNVSSGDAGQTFTAQQIQNAVISGCQNKYRSIVLMHDSSTKYATVESLQGIIDHFKDTHDFKALDNTVRPTVFTYQDNGASNFE